MRCCRIVASGLMSLWLGGMAGSFSPLAAQQRTALEVGTRSQLLIDHEAIAESRGLAFTLHPGHKHNARDGGPLVRADQPCEGWALQLYGSVLYDPGERLFKMWYDGSASDYFDHEVTFYATSRDGVTWDKSPRGTLRAKNGKPHHEVADGLVASVMRDSRDPDPARRYKMVCYQYDRGYHSLISPDGLRWQPLSREPIVPISYVDDVITACYSGFHQRFVVFPKNPIPVMGRLRRTLFSSTSFDFVHWSKLEPALVADRRDDLGSRVRAERVRPLLNFPDNLNVMRTEIYGTGTYAAESCLIAFPWMFTVTANIPKLGNHEGPLEVQLAVSRDLVHWERPFRAPLIEPGQVGTWDSGMFSTASAAFDYQDEVWLYYYGAGFTHGAPIPARGPDRDQLARYPSGIGLVKWKKDRFVSADAGPAGGTLTTVPLEFAGQHLEVNARVLPEGELTVELLDAGRRPIPGWPVSHSPRGDHLRHVVSFGGRTDLSPFAGKPLILRFTLRQAELFAFAFRK